MITAESIKRVQTHTCINGVGVTKTGGIPASRGGVAKCVSKNKCVCLGASSRQQQESASRQRLCTTQHSAARHRARARARAPPRSTAAVSERAARRAALVRRSFASRCARSAYTALPLRRASPSGVLAPYLSSAARTPVRMVVVA